MESENVLGEMLKKLLNPTGNAKDNEAIDKALEETKDFLLFAQEQGISPTDKQIEDLQKAAFYIQDEIKFIKSKQQEQ